MSPILNQLFPAIAAALPSNLLSTAENCIIIHPNSLHFGQHMGGGILISQDSDNVVTISYKSTNHGSLRVLLWGKDLFACINGISLALRGDEFSASVKIELGKLGKQGKGAVAKATVHELARYICHFVVKCEKVLDQIHDSYVENMHYQQLYLEMRTANYFLQNFDKDNLGKQFDAIYSVNRWGCGSGAGSLPQLTTGYRQFLQDFIAQHGIKTIADAGCGDWQFSRLMDFSAVQYTGYDVSSIVVEQNTKLYQKDNIKFVLYDGDFDRIEPADLLICKDVLQHLPNSYIQKFLQILPKFKFALITNDIDELHPENNNVDLPVAGGFRTLDLTKEPFNFKGELVHKVVLRPDLAYNKDVLLYTHP